MIAHSKSNFRISLHASAQFSHFFTLARDVEGWLLASQNHTYNTHTTQTTSKCIRFLSEISLKILFLLFLTFLPCLLLIYFDVIEIKHHFPTKT